MKTRLALALAFAFSVSQAFGQAAFPPPPPKVSPAVGVIDMHTHTHPDVFGRNMDDIDLATLAKARGMRGIVIKNHISETASRAALTMHAVPGIDDYSMLGKVWYHTTEEDSPGKLKWDLCILDGPV